MPVTTTIRAQDLLKAFGVDTHIPYTDGGYVNLANIGNDLKYLGITQIRDGITNGQNGSAPLSSYIQLAQQGIHFTIVMPSGPLTTADLQAQLSLVVQLNSAVPGSVTAVEGPNEINNAPVVFNGVAGLQGALALQQALYTAVHANAALAGVAVDYFTGYDVVVGGNAIDPATTAGLADYDNQHPYPHAGLPPNSVIDPAVALTNESSGSGPFVYTETGYSTYGGGYDTVSEDVQATYTLDLLLDAARYGASKTFLYQLLDAYAPGSAQGDDGFGLFGQGNQAKAGATAIHSLTTILQDTGSTAGSFTPGTLHDSILGLPATTSSLLVAKSDGSFDVAIWNEPTIWNPATKSKITATPATVTVQLGATYASVEIFDPLSGTSPIQTLTNVSSVQLALTDHPLIVDVGGGTSPTPVGNQTPPTFGSSDTTWQIVASADFTGDGLTDYVWRNAAGHTQIWNANGSGGYVQQDYGFVDQSWTIAGTRDATGDGKTDIIWQNTNGDQLAWYWNGGGGYSSKDLGGVAVTSTGTSTGTGTGTGGSGGGTAPTGTGGTSTGTGGTTTTPTGTQTPPTFGSSDTTWQIVASADFTGDGLTDYVWRNAAGHTQIWNANGSGGYVQQDYGFVDQSWTIAGTRDATEDRKTDIIWQNTNGDQLAWYWNGGGGYSSKDLGVVAVTQTGTGTGGSGGGTVPSGTGGTATPTGTGGGATTTPTGTQTPPTFGSSDTTWEIAASADFTGDGLTDYVWRNAGGQTQIWDANVSGSFIHQDYGVVDKSWTIVGTRDATGDGKTDIIWQNTSGDQLAWYWNGGGGYSSEDLGIVTSHAAG